MAGQGVAEQTDPAAAPADFAVDPFDFDDWFDDLVRCRECGCDNMHACAMDDGCPCWWVEGDLCSACQAKLSTEKAGSVS